ncbi:hypothetical protein EYF80_014850 [Liparis tanakae]|uniref:Uncharacterized protein n=1 Tax=Liparis tanakae TaxID=230148 RepID=A0A4Z2IBZ5_9TELE|nr:hypothetical protein EYF80_014850 [Liparis tanakae]
METKWELLRRRGALKTLGKSQVTLYCGGFLRSESRCQEPLTPTQPAESAGRAETRPSRSARRRSAPLLWLSCCSVYWLSRAPTCSSSLNGLGRKLDQTCDGNLHLVKQLPLEAVVWADEGANSLDRRQTLIPVVVGDGHQVEPIDHL